MTKFTLTFVGLYFLVFNCLIAQNVTVQGRLEVTQIDTVNEGDLMVVRGGDSTLNVIRVDDLLTYVDDRIGGHIDVLDFSVQQRLDSGQPIPDILEDKRLRSCLRKHRSALVHG